MPTQMEMPEMYDSVLDVLAAAVKVLGGTKKVGALLRPELDSEAGGTWLRDCLNPHRRERLMLEQVLLLLRLSRRAGFHAAMDWIAMDAGYQAHPIDVPAQMADLQRQFAETARAQSELVQRMERLAAVAGGAVADAPTTGHARGGLRGVA